MRLVQRVEDLEDSVDGAARLLVLLRLRQELVQIHLLHVATARHLQEHPHRGGGVLRGDQSGTIG